jgi:hypothetical protein
MSTPPEHLVFLQLEKLSAELLSADPTPAADLWQRAAAAIDGIEEELVEAYVAISDRDAAALADVIQRWRAGKLALPECDKAVLGRAMNAIRRRIKLTRLDAESTLGGPMTSGKSSGIVGVRAPTQYADEVWETLVRLGRLVDVGDGLYEISGS